YQNVGDWVGILFGVYNGISAIFAFFLPFIAKKVGRKRTHSISLVIGALGFLSIYIMPDENWLILSMVGIGVAWASILAMPYAILAGAIPLKKMGVYMGIFNFFIVIPQIVNALIGGPMVQYLYGGQPIYALVTSGVSFLIAALLVARVDDKDDASIAL
ncbi:MAG: MFS transporter, partial [Muricauda sp.]|nr:MFS transporter [Allomuricauda sp.]